MSQGRSAHTEMIEEDGETRYKITDIIGKVDMNLECLYSLSMIGYRFSYYLPLSIDPSMKSYGNDL